jgi:hypothetical protein
VLARLEDERDVKMAAILTGFQVNRLSLWALQIQFILHKFQAHVRAFIAKKDAANRHEQMKGKKNSENS